MAASPIRPLHLALFVFVQAIWAFNFPVSKWGLAELPPFLFVGLRFLLVALVLLPFVPRPHGKWRQVLLLSITLGFVHFAAMFNGLVFVPASTAALLVQMQVPFAALLAAAFLGDRLGWRRGLGLALAFAGVAVVLGGPTLEGPWWAQGLVLLAAFCWAIGAVQVKFLAGVPGATLNAWVAIFAVPQLFIASLIFEEGQWQAVQGLTWAGVGAIVYNSLVVVVLGYGIWYRLLRSYDVNQSMPFTLLILPLAFLFSGLFLGEALTWTLMLGGLTTLAGVAIIVLRRPRQVPPEATRV